MKSQIKIVVMAALLVALGGSAQAAETWYAITGTGAACGTGTRRPLSTTAGAAANTQLLSATAQTWNRTEASGRTIAAGTWQVSADVTTTSGGGPSNAVLVKVERYNSSCVLQQTIISESVAVAKGVTAEVSTTATDPGAVVISAGDIIVVSFTDGGGNQSKTLRYANAAGTDADTRLVNPATQVSSNFTSNATAALGISTSATAGMGFTRSAAASANLAPAATRNYAAVRAAAQSLSASPTATRAWTGTRTQAESLSLAPTASASMGFTRSAAAAVTFAPTASADFAAGRIAMASVTLDPQASRAAALTRQAAESIVATAAATRQLNALRSVNETLSFSVTAGAVFSPSRSASASLNLAVTSSRALGGGRAAAAALAIGTAAGRTLIAARSASAAVSLTPAGSRQLGASRGAVESVAFAVTADAVLTPGGGGKKRVMVISKAVSSFGLQVSEVRE